MKIHHFRQKGARPPKRRCAQTSVGVWVVSPRTLAVPADGTKWTKLVRVTAVVIWNVSGTISYKVDNIQFRAGVVVSDKKIA